MAQMNALIGTCGYTWNKETKSEDGNFTRFLRWKAERTIEGSK